MKRDHLNILSHLIESLCPNGIEYRKIKDIYMRLKGTSITAGKMKEIANAEGEIKVFAGGKTIVNAYEKDIPGANITKVPAVLVQSRGVIDVIYYDKPFTFKNEMWAYTAKDTIEVKYLYYVLKNNIDYLREAASGMGSLPQISLRVTENLEIPLPPLPIQQAIVNILDSFTELTTNLTTELATELSIRQKQYAYYRDLLLDPERSPVMQEMCPEGVEYGNIKSIYTRVKGTSITAGKMKEIANAEGEIKVFAGGKTAVNAYEKDIPGANITKVPAVLVQSRGVIDVIYYDKPFTFKNEMWAYTAKNSIEVKYLYYVLKNKTDYLRKAASGMGSLPQISLGVTENLQIPLPPLLVQERIVSILDSLDALYNDITSGLPAEIAARQKQYEFYQDQLLSFDAAA